MNYQPPISSPATVRALIADGVVTRSMLTTHEFDDAFDEQERKAAAEDEDDGK